MVVFFVKTNENTYQKGRALMQMYIVVPITKKGIAVFITMSTCITTYMYFCVLD